MQRGGGDALFFLCLILTAHLALAPWVFCCCRSHQYHRSSSKGTRTSPASQLPTLLSGSYLQASEGGGGPMGGEARECGNRSSPGVLAQSISFPDPKRAGEWHDALDSVVTDLNPLHQQVRRMGHGFKQTEN